MKLTGVAMVAAVAAAVVSTGALAQESGSAVYSDAAIEEAIDYGWRDRLGDIRHDCGASIGGFWNTFAEALTTAEGQPLREFRIYGSPPLARVAEEADFARRRYTGRPSADDVRHLLGDDIFTVYAEPNARGDMRTAANLAATSIETIVIRRRGDSDGRDVRQPLNIEMLDGTNTSNLFGANIEMFGAVGTFRSSDVRELIADSDLEVLLITGQGEFKCNLDDTRLKRGYRME